VRMVDRRLRGQGVPSCPSEGDHPSAEEN
jgi:hypothetical protein